MSQDQDVRLPKKSKTLHYGSLEEVERKRLKSLAAAGGSSDSNPTTITSSASINKMVDIEDASVNLQRKQILEELERKRKARQIAVAVDDAEVRAHLRSLDQPMTLFGEGPADRRERLRQLLARLGEDALKKTQLEEKREEEESKAQMSDKEKDKTWYHEGSESLRICRLWIAEYSLPRAQERLRKQKELLEIPEVTRTSQRNELYKNLRNLEISCSQVADARPISSCCFSPDNSLIATSSWSGLCKLWSMPDLNHVRNLRGHNAQASCIIFHPKATISQSPSSLNLASCGTDGSVFLWSLDQEEPVSSLDGHSPYRVSRLGFHPSGRFIATACHDKSWKLFDLGSEQEVLQNKVPEEILFQEGHSKGVFDLSFQADGSLLASGGMDSFGRVWDLRTGRCVMFLEGHLKGILSICFSPDGYHIVTGSEDHSVKVWNVRQRKLEYTIPAHNNLVSNVMFDKEKGSFIASCSYDNTVKLWSHPGWTPIHTLKGHDNKIMGMDITNDSKFVVTASYDRTFKLWTQDGLSFL